MKIRKAKPLLGILSALVAYSGGTLHAREGEVPQEIEGLSANTALLALQSRQFRNEKRIVASLAGEAELTFNITRLLES